MTPQEPHYDLGIVVKSLLLDAAQFVTRIYLMDNEDRLWVTVIDSRFGHELKSHTRLIENPPAGWQGMTGEQLTLKIALDALDELAALQMQEKQE